jgi:hypothetical protein
VSERYDELCFVCLLRIKKLKTYSVNLRRLIEGVTALFLSPKLFILSQTLSVGVKIAWFDPSNIASLAAFIQQCSVTRKYRVLGRQSARVVVTAS